MGEARSIEQDVEEARGFDTLRQQLLEMRQAGMAGMAVSHYGKKKEGWCAAGDLVEEACLVHTCSEDATHIPALTKSLDRLVGLNMASFFPNRTSKKRGYDQVPVLRAATTLEALSRVPTAALSAGAFSSFFRIVAELNSHSGPGGMAGGASAVAEGVPRTAFITWRCVRALSVFATAFDNAATVLDTLGVFTWKKPEIVPQEWWNLHSGNCQTAAINTLRTLENTTICRLFINEEPTKGIASNPISIAEFCATVRKNLKRRAEGLRRGAQAVSKLGPEHTVDQPACEQAQKIVLQLIAQFPDKPSAWTPVVFREAAALVRESMRLASPFLRSVLDHELSQETAYAQGPCDAAELLFAAEGLSVIGFGDGDRLAAALKRVEALITNSGRVPSHTPFDVKGNGYVLHVAGSEVVWAWAKLASALKYDVPAQTIHKLACHFTGTWREDAKGWRHERDHADGQCAWWLSALAVDALDALIQLLDARINDLVARNFSVRQIDSLKLELDTLFYTDYALVAAGVRGEGESCFSTLQRMRTHICDIRSDGSALHSAVLHGPPGTGKTTLVEAFAKTCGVPLVEITPSDILLAGVERLEARARAVFDGLCMLSNAVILFDEFDPILWRRGDTQSAQSVFQFLTPGILPKLKRLNESARKQRVCFVLSTNRIGVLDAAAIREGRFDAKLGVYPPDALSRLGRLLHQLSLYQASSATGTCSCVRLDEDDVRARLTEIVVQSAGLSMNRLGSPGWFSRSSQMLIDPCPMSYALKRDGLKPHWPSPEKELPATEYEEYDAVQPKEGAKLDAIQWAVHREWVEWGFVTRMDQSIDTVDTLDALEGTISSFIETYSV